MSLAEVQHGQGRDATDFATWARECPGRASFERKNVRNRNMRVVTAEHASKAAEDFFQHEIAPEIHSPTDWLFFIEGCDLGKVYEVNIARDIAKHHTIPYVDPIVSIDQVEVVDAFRQTSVGKKYPREMIIGGLVLDILRFRQTTDFAAAYALLVDFGTEEELRDDLKVFLGIQRDYPAEYAQYAEHDVQGLMVIANILSTQVMDYYLRRYSDRPEVALYCGMEHRPVINYLEEQIPEEMQFSDQQIEVFEAKRAERAKEKKRRFEALPEIIQL